MSQSIIALRDLSRRFGATEALKGVDLTVARGQVFGLVGENGAGKTTLIKHLLGLLHAQRGEVRVFGRDPVRDPVGVLSRLGYVAEQRDLPAWMRIDELMRYNQAFYPTWDEALAASLVATFELDVTQKVKSLSQGQRARTSLLLALAHRPPLLLLDEPSSGLDPVVRRDILEAIIRTVAEEGRTVLFSSHLLDEVERVADHVAMLHAGEVVLDGPLDTVREGHQRLVLRFPQPQALPPKLPGVVHAQGGGRDWSVLWQGDGTSAPTWAAAQGAQLVMASTPSLDEIFVSRVRA